MPAAPDGPASLLGALAGLGLPAGEFVVCGSAGLYARRLRQVIGNVDVAARGEAWRAAVRAGRPVAPPSGHGRAVYLHGGCLEIVDRWTPGYSTDDLIRNAEVIDGIPFMALPDLLRWKSAARREKDLPDITAISGARRAVRLAASAAAKRRHAARARLPWPGPSAITGPGGGS